MPLFLAVLAAGLALAALASKPVAAAPPAPSKVEDATRRCSALSKLRLPDTIVNAATFVPARAAEHSRGGDTAGHPGFCRVIARVKSAPGSDIGIEVWLPAERWTGVFHGNGNGGFGGIVAGGYPGMAEGLRRGFATATTDMGTAPATPLEGDALVGQPSKWRDWARRSTHIMTATGKAITKAFYGRDAQRSYFTGCSTGGQQGLIEALYYPDDYDGILVGAPVINRTWGHAAVLWNQMAGQATMGSTLSPTKLEMLNRAAIATCWSQGRSLAGDPFVSDPLSCTFDPQILQCKGAASDGCLTEAEIKTARAFYSGPIDRNGNPLYFGWLPGSEMPDKFGWSFLQTPFNGQPPFSGLFKWVFGAEWNWKQFSFERDMPRVDETLGPIVNDATRGTLDRFIARGGKLIIYHGLADTLVAPGQSVDFYERHVARADKSRSPRDNVRLFLAPGMMHCGGGSGPDAFNSALAIPPRPPVDDAQHDIFSALIAWTGGGEAPERIIATKFSSERPGEIAMQRPICAHPMKALYRGWGSTRVASSFQCARSD